MRRRVWIGLVLTLLIGLQFFQPAPPRPILQGEGPMTSFVTTPAVVQAVLRRACYDCHSSETRWPWYSRVSPFSWLIVGHVQHGRGNLDFSVWSTDPVREPTQEQRLTGICQEMRLGLMPLGSYLLWHSDARLTASDTELICAWTANALGGPRTEVPPVR